LQSATEIRRLADVRFCFYIFAPKQEHSRCSRDGGKNLRVTFMREFQPFS
jgi:hypothetical protein